MTNKVNRTNSAQKPKAIECMYKSSRIAVTLNSVFQLWFALGTLAAGGLATGYLLQPNVKAADLELHPPHFPWVHKGPFSSLDHAA